MEGKLGGQYRFSVGQLPPGTAPKAVKYDIKSAIPLPVLNCLRQITLTVAVVDIYQDGSQDRLTAFDAYWGGRPYFRARVWPGGEAYQWGNQYKLGRRIVQMPGTAVDGDVAFMRHDSVEREPRNGATMRPRRVQITGNANGSFTTKGRINGGFQINAPMAGQVPSVQRQTNNRYPDRVSLHYTVNGDRLVRPEHLAVILPQLGARPPTITARGNSRTVQTSVTYAIHDAFQRPILANSTREYVDFYGAGLKAWEALAMDPGNTREGGRRNDTMLITARGAGLRALNVGTAQRSQARVRPDRMTAASFTDTLRFNARGTKNARFKDWQAWTGNTGQAGLRAIRQEAAQRRRAIGRARTLADRNAIVTADTTRQTSNTIFSILQDVILQLRVGNTRHDLNVLQNNTMILRPPYFFETMPGGRTGIPFSFQLDFIPGQVVSTLVGVDHLRTPP